MPPRGQRPTRARPRYDVAGQRRPGRRRPQADDLDAGLRTLEASLRALEEAQVGDIGARCRTDGVFAYGDWVVSWVARVHELWGCRVSLRFPVVKLRG